MTGRPRRPLAAGAALALGLAVLSACTAKPSPAPPGDPAVPAGRFQLVAFDSCANALDQLRSAAKAYVGPLGLGGDLAARAVVPEAASAADGRNAGGQATPDYSRTNNHEAGVDEPDLVKTDGRRIVTVVRGVLRIVDPATRRVTGELDLAADAQDPLRWSEADLLLHGNRALVLVREGWNGIRDGAGRQNIRPGQAPGAATAPTDITGPRLMLIDVAGAPRLLSEYRIDGGLVDARQVGGIARVVVRSAPRLTFSYDQKATDAQRLAANRAIIDRAGADAWLPRYSVTSGDRTRTDRVGCDRVSRPATYSGTSMLTVLSFALNGAGLGDGDPVTVVADGDTVYSNGPRLYVANDQRWRVMPSLARGEAVPDPPEQVTEIYQFDTSGAGRPRYLAAGSVPGWLVNQYAMSEWDGHLRVATTSGRTWGENPRSSSAVYILRADGGSLTETARVAGLGKGERIYSVRFAGTTGYVVTFRQTDPLYTVDLTDPKAPKVSGELKITGYSAYLHPIDGGRLLGVGQEASAQGRTQGTQVSLFDVSDLAKPTRLAQHHVKRGHSEADFDPHAFLYWPADRLLVVPVTAYPAQPVGDTPQLATTGALALRVADNGFTEVGLVEHPGQPGNPKGGALIRRSLVVDGVLWTVSDAGLLASSVSTLDTLAWLPY